MHAAERPEFTPPPEPGLLRSVGLALLAHAVLVLGLSWGLKWKREDQNVAVEAELWASTVQQAAPKPQEAPPPPPAPAPAPTVQPPAPVQRDADIALERDRQRAAQEKARREEAERQRQQAERRREEQAKKAAEDRRRAEQAKAREKQDEARVAQMREENLRRIQGLAGATGVREATGTATRSAGPSDSYGGRIRARVKPNIVFTDDIPGNPSTEVEVRMAPNGSIVGIKVTRPSGVKAWDDAVVRALERTQELPRDVDGRVHSPLLIEFRPKG